MTKYSGSIPVTGTVTTTDTQDTYATHLDELGKGGYRVVDTIADRDDISSERRTEGMLVYVVADSMMYQLIGGSNNSNWIQPEFDTTSSLTDQYIFRGDASGKAVESADLIDVELDLILLNQKVDGINGSTPLLEQPSTSFPSAQVLSDMQPGFLLHSKAGKVISLPIITNDHLPGLAEGNIRVGSIAGRPEQVTYELNTIPANADTDLGAFGITTTSAPATGNHLANKNYVDSKASGGSDTITLTGAVTGSGSGAIDTVLTDINVSQITDFDDAVEAYPLSSFSLPTNDVNMGSQRISQLGEPFFSSDAATMGYVDTEIAAISTTPEPLSIGYTYVENATGNLNATAGDELELSYLSYVFNGLPERGFDMPTPGLMRYILPDSGFFMVTAVIGFQNIFAATPETNVTFSLRKNGIINAARPVFKTRLLPETPTVSHVKTLPIFLNQFDNLILVIESSVTTQIEITDLIMYVEKY